MDNELSLQDVFDGVEESAEAETEDATGETSEATATPEAEPSDTEAEQGEAEQSSSEDSTAEDSTPESESEEDEQRVPVAALKAERSKRQELERRLQALEGQKQQGQEDQDAYPDVFADQEGFTKRFQEEVDRKVGQVRIETAQQIMRSMHEDYDDREAKFLEYANENPSVLSDPKFKENPALFAYEFAGKLDEFSQVKNLDSYKERLREQIRKEVLAETQQEQQKRQETAETQREAEMPSLASSGSTGPGVSAEPSLSELLPGA